MTRRVFVSYSRSQFYLAEDIALSLSQRGVNIWFDVHQLEAGADWERAVDEGLVGSDVLLLVASRQAFASEAVGAELIRARELGLRVVVARTDLARWPAALRSAPSVDVRF